MTAITDNFKTMLISDGEAITFGDTNDAQRFLSARLSDQILGNLIGGLALVRETGITVTVASSGALGLAQYTRSAGSWLTSRFAVGQTATMAGFVNGSNNQTAIISSLTSTVMILASNIFVAEGPTAATSASATISDPEFGASNGRDPAFHLAYCLHGGSAYLYQGVAQNQIVIAPGVLFQKLAAADGNDATLIGFTFDGTASVSIAAGDPSHPRVDLVQMALAYVDDDTQLRDFQDAVTGVPSDSNTNKKHRVQCTLSVKQGTPAASPVYPDPDAGNVAIAGVVVGTSYVTTTLLNFGTDTTGANATVHDQRMPLNVQAYHEDPALYKLVTAWSLAGSNTLATASNNSNDLRAFCGKGGAAGRIVGLGIYYSDALGIVTIGNNGSGGTAFAALNQSPSFGVAADRAMIPYWMFEAHHDPASAPIVLPSPVNMIGVPIWTNGTRCAAPRVSVSLVQRVCARIQTGSSLSTVSDVVWYVAQGI